MSSRPLAAPLARAVGLTALVTALLGTAACGAGLHPQTYQPRAAANASNGAVRDIVVRNAAVRAPANASLEQGAAAAADSYPAGSDAEVDLTLINHGGQADQLVGATSDVAGQVVMVSRGAATAALAVPAGGAADPTSLLVLQGLTRALRSGDYVTLHLQFAVNGSGALLVPVAIPTGPAAVQATAPPSTDSSAGASPDQGSAAPTSAAQTSDAPTSPAPTSPGATPTG